MSHHQTERFLESQLEWQQEPTNPPLYYLGERLTNERLGAVCRLQDDSARRKIEAHLEISKLAVQLRKWKEGKQ